VLSIFDNTFEGGRVTYVAGSKGDTDCWPIGVSRNPVRLVVGVVEWVSRVFLSGELTVAMVYIN
jgi:hypothetical protein